MNLMTDKNTVEFYVDDNRLYYITGGVEYAFSDITVDIANMIRRDMESNGSDIVLEKHGVTDYMDQLRIYATCRYGALNMLPDFVNGKSVDSEFYCCSTKNCRFGQKLCKMSAQYGDLTRQEQIIGHLVAEDKSDKIIADQVGISVNTVHTHITHLLGKIGAFSRVGIATYFSKHSNA
jgi:DNA-binding CsgD family transcriptional regulator